MGADPQREGTLNYQDAWFRAQETNPSIDPRQVLDYLKSMERVTLKHIGEAEVFEYIVRWCVSACADWQPDLMLNTEEQVRTHIRVHSTPTKGISWKELREAMPQHLGVGMIDNLEQAEEILVMRNLTGERDPRYSE